MNCSTGVKIALATDAILKQTEHDVFRWNYKVWEKKDEMITSHT